MGHRPPKILKFLCAAFVFGMQLYLCKRSLDKLRTLCYSELEHDFTNFTEGDHHGSSQYSSDAALQIHL